MNITAYKNSKDSLDGSKIKKVEIDSKDGKPR